MHAQVVAPRGLVTLAALLLTLLILLGIYAWQIQSAAWEVGVVRAVQEAPVPGLRPLSITLAVAGTGLVWGVLLGLFGIALWVLGSLRLVALLVAVTAMQDVGRMVKLLTERARPQATTVEVWQQISSYSFPSGHVLGATLVFGFLFFAVEHCALPAVARRAVRVACVAWILLMGVARMELGAHWPTDVLGGWLLGALLLLPIVALLPRSAHGSAPAIAEVK